jgi:hypothetical protein
MKFINIRIDTTMNEWNNLYDYCWLTNFHLLLFLTKKKINSCINSKKKGFIKPRLKYLNNTHSIDILHSRTGKLGILLIKSFLASHIIIDFKDSSRIIRIIG